MSQRRDSQPAIDVHGDDCIGYRLEAWYDDHDEEMPVHVTLHSVDDDFDRVDIDWLDLRAVAQALVDMAERLGGAS